MKTACRLGASSTEAPHILQIACGDSNEGVVLCSAVCSEHVAMHSLYPQLSVWLF